ncbi:MAG: hypothetical protein IT384_23535 [Deltaproteobacteria bacterium]|nr:hypothetical protein [Deltaproteobacteria bacterium]
MSLAGVGCLAPLAGLAFVACLALVACTGEILPGTIGPDTGVIDAEGDAGPLADAAAADGPTDAVVPDAGDATPADGARMDALPGDLGPLDGADASPADALPVDVGPIDGGDASPDVVSPDA